MIDDYRSVMMHIVWGHGLMPTAVLVHWFLGLKYLFSYKFRPQGRKSSWISTQLTMMVDYRSVIMYIIWSHGLLPTTVLVDWFLELELSILL